MTHYEIHVFSKRNQDQVPLALELLSDHAAMRRADTLANDGARVEIWRGGSCIYSVDGSE